eukprot:gene16939-18645_t
MDSGKCFADVINDPQALNDFLTNAQLLADQENRNAALHMQQQLSNHHTNNSDALAAIVAKATDGQVAEERNQSTNSSPANAATTINYGNSQRNIPNYSNSQVPSVAQTSNIQSNQNLNFMQKQSQQSGIGTLLSKNVLQNNTSISGATSGFIATQAMQNQLNYGNTSNAEHKANASKIYLPKNQGKQTLKHMPNILSKGTAANAANIPTSQTILLPTNMSGKYIIVNNPGQTSQSSSAGQNAGQGAVTASMMPQEMLQTSGQQNQQVLLLPSNFQKLVTPANAMQNQASIAPNRRVNSPRQQAPIQPLVSAQQQSKQSPGLQKQIQQKMKASGTVLPRQQPLVRPGTSSPAQQSSHLQGYQTTQQLTRNISGQVPITSAIYQMQNTQTAMKASDSVKIVRPAVQPRGILPKPANQGVASKVTETKTDAKQPTAKLSHFPVAQSQLQNLQNLVAKQDSGGQYVQTSQPGNKLPVSGQKLDQSASIMTSSQQRLNVPLGSPFTSVAGDSNASMQLQQGGHVALQQLLQLSQAATQAENQSIAEASSAAQKAILTSQQQQLQNRSRFATQQQQKFLQQALTANSNTQAYLQSVSKQQQSNISSNDVTAATNRKAIIEKNVKTIISRQNASKQAQTLQKNPSDSSQNLSQLPNTQQVLSQMSNAPNLAQNVAQIADSAATTQQQQQALQLFMPKQLSSSQLMELQQKLLVGKIMQKMQEVQPKNAAKLNSSGTATASPSNVLTAQQSTSGQSSPAMNQSGSKSLTLKQIPGTGSSGPSYQFVAIGEEGTSNQVVVPISTPGMQALLKANPGIAQSIASSSGKAQGGNQLQKANLPVLQGNVASKSTVGSTGAQSVQGVRIQNAAMSNIVIKPMDGSFANKSLSEQQKAVQTKRLQQLLLQLTPAQRNILLKKQQEFVNKGQTIPLAKLIGQVKQEKQIPIVKAPTVKDIRPLKRHATDEVKTDESTESKIARRLKHCLSADQTRTVEPVYNAPFTTVEDALSRLLPYHIHNEPIPPDIEWQKAEAVFNIVSKQLINRKEKLFDKYHTLLLEESQHEIPSSEMVMLERVFLADEKARLAKDREDVKLGKFKLFKEEDPATVEEVDEDGPQDLIHQKTESSMLDIEEDIDIEKQEELLDEEHIVEEESSMEKEDDEDVDIDEVVDIDEEEVEENEEDDDEEDIEDKYDDEEDVDEEDDEEEDNDEEDDEEIKVEYERNTVMNQVLNHQSENNLSELVDIDVDFDGTNEQNMSEELSEATFNLMADLENEMEADYYD